jgi:CBS domain-containing protein
MTFSDTVTGAETGSSAGNPAQSGPVSDTYDSTLRYLSAVVAREARRPGVESPVPHGPERVRDVMVTSVVAAREGAVFKEIVDALIRNRVSAVPVIDADRRVLGVVSEADLLARVSKAHLALPRGHRLSAHSEERRKLHAATARELMTSPACVIAPHAAITEAAWHAARSRVRRLPVVDDNGVLVGIVSRSDLLRPFLRPDEEIGDDITQNVIIGAFMLNPNSVFVEVDEGVVTLRGQVERRSVAVELVDNVCSWSGVVDVIDELTYKINDALPGTVPAVLY